MDNRTIISNDDANSSEPAITVKYADFFENEKKQSAEEILDTHKLSLAANEFNFLFIMNF